MLEGIIRKKRGKNKLKDLEIIAIDHGWSLCKTPNYIYTSGVREITTEPAYFDDVLEYRGRYFKVGTDRLEVKATKVETMDYYYLTLAGIAKELRQRGKKDARVVLAVGLPASRYGDEKSDFIKYLKQNDEVYFKFEKEKYHIWIDKVFVYPQCYAAVVDQIMTFGRKVVVVDIGSWTIDVIPVVNKYPDDSVYLFEAAQYYARKCDYEKAIALYERSFALETRHPRFQDELMAIAEIYEIQGDYRKAAETYGRIIDLLENEWGMTEEAELEQAKREKARLLALA